jgi:hypothetical protein
MKRTSPTRRRVLVGGVAGNCGHVERMSVLGHKLTWAWSAPLEPDRLKLVI